MFCCCLFFKSQPSQWVWGGISSGLMDIADGNTYQISPFFRLHLLFHNAPWRLLFQGCQLKSHIGQNSRYPLWEEIYLDLQDLHTDAAHQSWVPSPLTKVFRIFPHISFHLWPHLTLAQMWFYPKARIHLFSFSHSLIHPSMHLFNN